MLAGLVLGRIELAAGDADGGSRLAPVVARAAARHAMPDEAFPAAIALTRYYIQSGEFQDAYAAADFMDRLADGDVAGADVGHARAHTLKGISLLMRNMGRLSPRLFETWEAEDHFDSALGQAGPQALASDSEEIGAAEAVYAEALAWRSVLQALHLGRHELTTALDHAGAPSSQCAAVVVDSPTVRTPAIGDVEPTMDFGVIVTRLDVDGSGVVQHAKVAAVLGHRLFAGPLVETPSNWRVLRSTSAPANCSMAMTRFAPIVFLIQSNVKAPGPRA
jgi:hypothetical protein